MQTIDDTIFENKWISKIWSSDLLLEITEDSIISQINCLNNNIQKKLLYDWSFPNLDEVTEALVTSKDKINDTDTTVNKSDSFESFISIIKQLSNSLTNKKLEDSDYSLMWSRLIETDKKSLFNNKYEEFQKWFGSLSDEDILEYSSRINKGFPIYPQGVTDFIKNLFDNITKSQFVNISILNGILAISSTDILKLNHIKTIINSTNAKIYDYRKKITEDQTVLHTILYRISDLKV
jgi:hypothetical protein